MAIFRARRHVTDARLRQFVDVRVESLERRLVLSASEELADWFGVHGYEDGLFVTKTGNAKPYIVAEVDLTPLIGALSGAIGGAGVGAVPGYFAGKLIDIFTGGIDGFVAIDGLDLVGRTAPDRPWLTQDAAENFVTVILGLQAGFGTSIGLKDLIGGGGSVQFIPAESADCDPSLDGIEWFDVGGLVNGDLSTNLASVTLVEGTKELLRTEIRRDHLLDNAERFTFGAGLLKSLVEDLATHQNRVATSTCEPPHLEVDSSIVSLPITGERYPLYLDAVHASQTFDVVPASNGNLSIEVLGLSRRFNGTLELFDSSGNRVATGAGFGTGGNPRLIYPSAQVGIGYHLVVSGIGESQAASIAVSQPPTIPVDPLEYRVIPPTASDDIPDRYEDAKQLQLSNSGVVSISKVLDGNLHETADGKDHDWFFLTAQKDGPLIVTISGLDASVRVHGPDSTTLKVDSDPNPSVALLDVRAGQTFRIDVGPNGPGVTGRYTLQVSQPSSDLLPPILPLRDNDVPWLAGVAKVLIPLSGGNGHSIGSIDDPGDVRWFQIDGANEGNMEVTVAPVNDDLKPFVTAFRADGGGIDTDTGEFDGEARVGFHVAAGERIIVAVSSHEGRYSGGFTINVSQPDNLPDDDVHDFGDSPRDLGPQITQEGDGSFAGKIETAGDNDWFQIPIRGSGFLSIEVSANNSTVLPFLELSRDGTSGSFFETDDGRDGKAKITFLPEPGQSSVWARVSSLDGTTGNYTLTTWRSQNPDDDYPDSGGVFLSPRRLAGGGQILIPGRLDHPGDTDNFHIRVDQPGPVAIEIIPLTEGFVPFFSRARQHNDPNQRTGTSGGNSGRGGRAFEMLPDIMPAPDNWITINVRADGDSGSTSFGDYIIHVWQPGSSTDNDSDTVGIEASPILLDGSGNGTLPGSPNGGSAAAPSLNHAGDKDVFQIVAASDRPITFTVSQRDTFITVFDANGHSLATDHSSGANGVSQITLDAVRGELFYLEVTAFNGTDTGQYRIDVNQPADDHPDLAIVQPKPGQTRDATPIELNNEGFGQQVGRIESQLVGDRDVFRVTSSTRGQFIVDAVATIGLESNWQQTTTGTGTVNVANNEDVELSIQGNGAPTDDNTATVMAELSVSQELVFDVSGNFGASHNWGLIEFSDGTNGLQIALEAPNGDLGGGEGGTNGNYALYGIGAWQRAGGSTFIAPFQEDVAHRVSIRQESSQVVVTWNGQEIGRFEASLPTDSTFRIWAKAAQAPDRNALVRVSNVTLDGVRLSPNETPITLDPLLIVYDSHGQLVAIDDDGGDGRNSHTVFNTFQGETYFIEVSGYGDRSVGSYRVTVQASELPRAEFVGVYDDFSAGQVNDLKWRSRGSSGNGSIQQGGGVVQLSANGAGANNANNSVDFISRASVIDDVELDFVARVPSADPALNGNVIELTDFAHYLGFDMVPDGAGSIRVTPRSNYQQLQSIGSVTLTQGSSHHVRFDISNDSVGIVLDGTELARYAGPLWANTVLRSSALAWQAPIYDDFNDNSIEGSRWGTAGDVEERDGRLHLWLRRNGSLQDSLAETQDRRTGIRGFKLNADRTAGTVSGGQAEAWVGITNDTDWVRIRWLSDVNQLIVQASAGYGGLGDNQPVYRWDPDSPGPAETPDGPFEIRERNGNIEFLHNNAVQFTLQNQTIKPGSWFEARAYGRPDGEGGPLNRDYELMIDDLQLYDGSSYLAELTLDNVAGTFALPADPIAVPYDNFDDNSINYDKFQVSGTAEERDGALKLSLFRQRTPVSGYASTSGNPDGINLRGFKLNANRTTEPKRLSGWDTTARMRLTNGVDFIEIDWKLDSNIFRIETAGAYGHQSVDISVPAGEVPDGPLEIRERDGNIEVLHNNTVKLTLANQTVRGGSFFTFESAGQIPGGGNPVSPPEDFDIFIDNLVFYHDPAPVDLRVTPSLKAESDTGASNVDHVTNQLTLQFQWEAVADAAKYQWREGELLDDGTIAYGPWSAPQSETSATVPLPHASIHVFSVRPINAQGIVGEESARGVQVDVTVPVLPTLQNVTGIEATGPNGAAVSYSGTADDPDSGSLPLEFDPPSGTIFPLGTTTVQYSATDLAGNTTTGTFTVTVVDTTAPTLPVLANIINVEATGPNGAVVSYSGTASDVVDGIVDLEFDVLSGAVFPLGTTTVNYSATDVAGNQASNSFIVTVVDTTAPTLPMLPNIANVEATGPDGAAVIYNGAANDLVDGTVSISFDILSGSMFPLGNTTVRYSATDAAGNAANGSFTVTVVDTTAPTLPVMSNINAVEATGPNGAAVSYSGVATDLVNGAITLNFDVASGNVFPLGTTTVQYSATDAAGNQAKASFAVTVVDTTAPVISDLSVIRSGQPQLEISFSEPIVATSENVVVHDAANQVVTPVSFDGSGTTTLIIALPVFSQAGIYSVAFAGITDVVGNVMADATQQFSSVGEFDSETGTLTLFAPGNTSLTVGATAQQNVLVRVNGVTDASFSTVAASLVQAIEIQGGAGANKIDLGSVTRTNYSFVGGVRVQVFGGDGNDTIVGSEFDDSLFGDAGNDTINAGGGNDTLSGGDGKDMLTAGAGTDLLTELVSGVVVLSSASLKIGPIADKLSGFENASLTGSDGNDSISASAVKFPVTLIGGAGNDTLTSGSGTDSLVGGDGDDKLVGGSGSDTLNGEAGADTLTGADGLDQLDGGEGSDLVAETANANMTLADELLIIGSVTETLVSIERAFLTGGVGNNVLNAAGFTLGNVTLSGGSGNDSLLGTAFDDSLDGGSGKDTLQGSDGDDVLNGGTDHDRLVGDTGDDTLTGGAGNDSLDGGADTDRLVETANANFTLSATSLVGLGTDTLVSGSIEAAVLTGGKGANALKVTTFAGFVTLDGAGGKDTLIGGSNDDVLLGGDGDDSISGGGGNDVLSGGTGKDTLRGDDGSETILGGAGADKLFGGNGNDTLSGEADNDTLSGDADADVLFGGPGTDSPTVPPDEDTLDADGVFAFDINALLIGLP